MKQQIRKIAACIITIALFLTICPVMGSAAFGGEDLLRASKLSAERSAMAGFHPMQADASSDFGTLEVCVQIEGARSASLSTKSYTVNVTDPYGRTDSYSVTCDIPTDELISASTIALRGLFPGQYTVSLDRSGAEIDGNVLSGVSGEGSVTVTAGTTSSADITVSYITTVAVGPEPTLPPRGSINVYLTVQGVPQSALSGKQYTITIAGEGTSKEYTMDCSRGGTSALTLMNGFAPGVYTVTESRAGADIDGYTMEVSGESTVTVEAGGDATVSIVNTYTAIVPETTPPQNVGGITEEPTPTPEDTPMPEETPEPTSTPVPSETPEPTPEPTPMQTVSPEPEPATTPEPTPTPTETPAPNVSVYIDDRDENIELPVGLLDEIEDIDDAVEAVQTMTDLLTTDQKTSHTAIDIATLYAERAASKTAVVEPDDEDEIWINAALLHRVDSTVKSAAETVRDELEDNGIDVDRKLPKTIILYVGDRTSFTAKVDPDVLTTDVDKVRVETDRFAVTFKLEDLEPDLKEILRFKAEEVGPSGKPDGQTDTQPQMFVMAADKAAGNDRDLAVQLTMPDGGITNPITLSLSAEYSENPYETMMLNGQAAPSKYNPVTITIDGKTTSSGTYTTDTNEVDFSDISGKSEEMQEAIKNLASRGILVGTSESTFSPDESISRAEIATLLVRVLGLYDESAIPTYTDVTKADWYYVGAASSQRAKLMSGYGDNKFHGLDIISKEQIMAASGNVLVEYMDYEVPANPEKYLSRFVDTVPDWGKNTIAIATQENLVIYRTDNKFLGASDMTRGDAAIVINRLFRRIW